MVDVANSTGPVDRLHQLLLALSGRLDDDALNTAREFAGAEQPDSAAEFVTGALLAGGIAVTRDEQRELSSILGRTNSRSGLAERLTVDVTDGSEKHRFTEPERVEDVSEALRAVTARLPNLRSLWCAARTTAAGVAAGAVPRRVLLAEVDGSTAIGPTDYQLLRALHRNGIQCSVEAFGTGEELPDYHREALAVAHEVRLDHALGTPAESTRGGTRHREGIEGFTDPLSYRDPLGEPSSVEQSETGVLADSPTLEPDLPSVEMTTEWPASEFGNSLNADLSDDRDPLGIGFPEAGYRESGRESGYRDSNHGDSGHRQERSLPPEPDPEETGFILPEPAPSTNHADSFGFPEPGEYSEPGDFPSPPEIATFEPAPIENDQPAEQHSESREDGNSNPAVPAAVDAKLTDRERNLLQKLHEELAHREQDKSPGDTGNSHEAVGAEPQQDPRTTTVPGTGNFPPIGSTGPNQPR
ncbi:hypothetical protein SAMN04487819_104278 [Actinopolyspora alba]|uniref:Uncharacterized protein n=1 Tax=Actinopolyspora alba TaxID=673379 RepID=A0A1I1VWJ1_9ACTN|nr:hypothetical protein [Actinopolyspora alba]SFD87476.1 hypothetical protein SAMN04487819_104278 [Actinopolyspora alba]